MSDDFIPLEKLKSHRRKESVKKFIRQAKEKTKAGVRKVTKVTSEGIKAARKGTVAVGKFTGKGIRATEKALETGAVIAEKGRRGLVKVSAAARKFEKRMPKEAERIFGKISPSKSAGLGLGLGPSKPMQVLPSFGTGKKKKRKHDDFGDMFGGL